MSERICKFISRPTCLECIKTSNMLPEKRKPEYYSQFAGLRSCSGCEYIYKYASDKKSKEQLERL